MDKKNTKEPKFKIGDEVWIIKRDLSISPKRIVGYKEVEGKITYELDVRFCQGISESELLKTLIYGFSKEGDIVLDCFSGSGNTAIASIELKRKFVGCDLNPTYAENSNARLSKLNSEGKFFSSQP